MFLPLPEVDPPTDRSDLAPDGGDGIERLLVTVTVPDYHDGDLEFTAGVAEQRDTVERWWCGPELDERGFRPVHAEKLDGRRAVEDFVHEAGLREAGPSTALVLYIAGHGKTARSGYHYLRLPASDPQRLPATAYRTMDLAAAVLDSLAEHVLVIVNTCDARGAEAELARLRNDIAADRRSTARLAVVVTTDVYEPVQVREFSEVLAEAYEHLRETGAITTPYLSVNDFVGALQDAARGLSLRIPTELLKAQNANEATLCLPNPGYRSVPALVAPELSQVADTRAELDDWVERASGRTGRQDGGWYFAGRSRLTAVVADFLAGPAGVLLVSGATGTGKSAVIARAVTLSDASFRAEERYAAAVTEAPERTVPPVGSIDVAVLARNLDVAEIFERVLVGLGCPPTAQVGGADRVLQLREQLLAVLAGAGRLVTLVVDGLDEARAPYQLVTGLIAPLARFTAAGGAAEGGQAGGGLRLVIGVRSVVGRAVEDAGLLRLLERVLPGAEVLRTDGADTAADIECYLRALLPEEGAVGGRYRSHLTEVARRCAPSFLDARLAGRQLRESPDPAGLLRDERWWSSLGEGTVGLLRQDLAEVATPELPAPTVLALLGAGAFAQGAGVPRADVWPLLAEALAGDGPVGATPVPDRMVALLLDSRLAGYLRYDSEDGRAVYRPTHERLAEVLRTEPHRLLWSADDPGHGVGPADDPAARAAAGAPAPPPGPWWEPRTAHRRIAEALADRGRDRIPHPYIARHLARHAALGGVLDDRHLPPDVLPWHTGGAVRGLLGLPVADREGRRWLAAWSRIEPFLGGADHRARVASLVLARHASADGRSAVGEPQLAGSWLAPVWSRWSVPGNVLASVPHTPSALAAFTAANGETWLATGDAGGALRIWDPATGEPVGEAMTGHGGRVAALAAVTVRDGRVLLASGGDDGTVRLWDPVAALPVGGPLTGHDGRVLAITVFTGVDGRTLLATGGEDCTVRLWDPVACRAVRSPLAGHRDWVRSVAGFALRPDLVLLASGDGAGVLRLWDPQLGEAAGTPLTGLSGDLGTVAAFTGPDGRVLLAGAGDEGVLRVWDPDRNAPVGDPLAGHEGWVRSVAVGALPDGRVLLASGGDDGTVRLWDPVAALPVGEPLTGHAGGVLAVAAFTAADGRPLLASTGEDRTVRVWDLSEVSGPGRPAVAAAVAVPGAAGRSSAGPGPGRAAGVAAVAVCTGPDGRMLVAAGGEDGRLRVWDPQQDRLVGESPWVHAGGVRAVAAVVSGDGRVLVAGGGDDGAVRLWDPVAGLPVGEPLTGHAGGVLALTAFPGADGRPRLAVGGVDETVRIWDPMRHGPRRVVELRGHRDWVRCLTAFTTPAGRVLVASGGDDGTVQLWDPLRHVQVETQLTGHDGPVTSVVVFATPDGRRLLAAGGADGTIRLWDALTGRPTGQMLTGHADEVHGLAVPDSGPDGRVLLASGGADGTVRLWDPLGGGELLAVVTGRQVLSLAACATAARSAPALAFGGPAGLAVVTLDPAG
ncbi:hypothetical protein ACFVVX_34360 [Kitasatospora sp. NPDC058170]|uniref:hypothetical protein n=1 Tax=Kitasatospora sp. NPDC058170 TaxID=3346364 RepID=UPI0036D80FC6